MAFRIKTKQRLMVEERLTVDAKHNNILQSFTENKNYLPTLKEELEVIVKEISRLNYESAKSLIININLQKQIWELDDKKKQLEKEIYDIEHNTDENEYMLKTGKILSDYYKIIEQEKEFTIGSNSNDSKINCSNNTTGNVICNVIDNIVPDSKKKRIMDWFSQSTPDSGVFQNVNTGKKIVNVTKKKSEKSVIDSKKNASQNDNVIISLSEDNNPNKKIETKDSVYERFMKIIDKNYININNNDIEISDNCKQCLVEMLLNNNTGILICPKCGCTENIIVDSDKPSFKEPPKEMTSFCYKRINHLNEFLAQFQAKETTDIPEDVYNEILMEIKKERITNMALITPEKMRIILKKIRKNDYYEHIPYIINQLNGLPAPVIAPEIEEIIRGMFKAIQIPFEKYCPPKRKNFLSYNYIMYKFFELLELDEYLTCFQLLKSRTKLHQQDQIWKNICKDLNWQYIRSL
jgi:hypothetical protein